MEDPAAKIFNEDTEVIVLYPDQVKQDRHNIIFWYKERNKIRIDYKLFIDLLNQLGFRIYFIGRDYLFVHIENNIVEETEPVKMKDAVREYIMDTKMEYAKDITAEKILATVINHSPTLFSRGNLEYLDKLGDDFNRDTRNVSFIYFRNCFVKVSAEGYTTHNYEELQQLVWKKQIIDRDFYEVDTASDFKTFIFRVCRDDAQRYDSLRSVIGYLLHGYKDPAMAKAIIFMDEKIDDGSNGGCGKSLLGNAISKVRKSLRLGGKNFRFDRFSFQSYEPGTDIIEFNDLSRNFQFDMLFTAITDNIVIEKKNKDEIIIPFEQSPKILLSTNYTIKGVDESTLRRQFIIEFSDYFNLKYSPEDEFGRRFFDDWNEENWCSFYIFMIHCLQFYLKNGLVEYARVNLDKKKLIESTAEEFVEFADGLEPNILYDNKKTYRRFLEEYPDYDNKNMLQRKFTYWLKIYAKLKGYKFIIKKSGTERSFVLKNLSNDSLDADII